LLKWLFTACLLATCLQDIEEALMKRDVKRQKLTEGKNVPELVARVNESNAAALRRRTKMMLPAPQVGMQLGFAESMLRELPGICLGTERAGCLMCMPLAARCA
jgi:hypothetical protein